MGWPGIVQVDLHLTLKQIWAAVSYIGPNTYYSH